MHFQANQLYFVIILQLSMKNYRNIDRVNLKLIVDSNSAVIGFHLLIAKKYLIYFIKCAGVMGVPLHLSAKVIHLFWENVGENRKNIT